MSYRGGMGTADNIAILLLPGMDGSGVLLTGLVHRLSQHRPVRVISYPNSEPLTYDELTTFVIERTPDSRFVILGESFSGPIAIEVAATEPRVAGLILASSFARHPLPTLFVPLAQMLDLRWVPARNCRGRHARVCGNARSHGDPWQSACKVATRSHQSQGLGGASSRQTQPTSSCCLPNVLSTRAL